MDPNSRFHRDLTWNLLSVVILGVSGLGLNLVIGRGYGPATLGVFNQALACYLIFSQLAVGGLYFSTLYFCGSGRSESVDARVLAPLVLASLQATLVCGLAGVMAYPIAVFLDSTGTRVALLCTLPGLWFFTLNKVLLSCFNGYRYMRLFAVFQSLRYLLMMVGLLLLYWQNASGPILTLCLTGAEVGLFPFLIAIAARERLLSGKAFRQWVVRHSTFGGKAFLSGLLLDVNTRVDVVVLGWFCGDAEVGVYSCAALFAEGFYLILTAVQSNLTPLFSEIGVADRQQRIRELMKQTRRSVTPALFLLWIISTPVFSGVVQVLTGSSILARGWPIYMVLGAGFVLSSLYLPHLYVLNQWGYPTRFVALLALIALTNLGLNLVAVPFFGGVGAAGATALSWATGYIYLRFLLGSAAGVKI